MTGEELRFHSPLPADLEALLAELRRSNEPGTFNEVQTDAIIADTVRGAATPRQEGFIGL